MKSENKRKLLLFVVFFSLLLIDVFSKFLVVQHVNQLSFFHPFYPYGGIGVFKDFLGVSFSINYVENTGLAWGFLAGHPALLFVIRIIVSGALIGYLSFFNKERSLEIPLWLVVTGALGNILDYLFYGHVVDFFYFHFGRYPYPLFNIADSLITIGIIYLILLSFIKKVK